MLRVRGSTSTKTGRAPTATTTLAVATQVIGVVITSSPGPIPAARSATSIVAVPLASARTGRPSNSRDSAASNSTVRGPDVIQPDARTSPTAAIVSASIDGRVKGSGSGTRLPSAARDDQDAEQDEEDPGKARGTDRLAEQPPRGDRVDDVAEREHRVGDRDVDARQRDQPDGDAHHVAR